MGWKESLDHYLTTEPDNGFDDWCEAVLELLSDEFFEKNEDWVSNCNSTCNKWLNKIYDKKGYLSIQESAKLIERTHKIFIK